MAQYDVPIIRFDRRKQINEVVRTTNKKQLAALEAML